MKKLGVDRFDVRGNKLIIKNYYNKILDYETEEKIGLLSELPEGPVLDIWCSDKRYSINWLEFMYNNKNQPNTDIDWTGKKRGYINGSKANAVRNLGSMKEIWKKFECEYMKEFDFDNFEIRDIEEKYWDYYISKYKNKFENCVRIFEKYIKLKRELMSEEEKAKEEEHYPFLIDEDVWVSACRDYLEYLVRVKTVRGFITELVFFKSLEDITGGKLIESTKEEESKGIDGYILLDGEKYAACLKPSTYTPKGDSSPVYMGRYVEYKQDGEDLVFVFKTGKDLLEKKQPLSAA